MREDYHNIILRKHREVQRYIVSKIYPRNYASKQISTQTTYSHVQGLSPKRRFCQHGRHPKIGITNLGGISHHDRNTNTFFNPVPARQSDVRVDKKRHLLKFPNPSIRRLPIGSNSFEHCQMIGSSLGVRNATSASRLLDSAINDGNRTNGSAINAIIIRVITKLIARLNSFYYLLIIYLL